MKLNSSSLVLTVALSTLLGFFSMPSQASENAASQQYVKSRVLDIKPVKTHIDFIPDVVYSQVPSRGFQNVALYMDIMQPKKNEKMPAIIFVTGGGFINANRANGIQERLRLAEAGYVVASINYRVAPTSKFPQPLEDVKSAIRYIKANADKFNVDPKRVGIIGGSAGGYLSAMAATTSGSKTFDKGDNLDVSSDVKCAVDLFGLSDLTRIGDDFSEDVQLRHKSAGATEALWVNGSAVFESTGGSILSNPKAAELANPIHYISKSSAPMLLMHGSADKVVSPSQTDLLFQALRKNGIESERYVITDAEHGGVYWVQDVVMDIIIGFFDRHLK